jgi:hypothetical protein
MRFINRKTVALTGAGAALVALASTGTAVASSLIDSSDIKDNSVRAVDIQNGTIGSADIKDGSVRSTDMSTWVRGRLAKAGTPGAQGPAGAKGETGAQGPAGAKGETGAQGPKGDSGAKGADGLLGAFYATAYYDAGNTNEGAIASVACSSDPAETSFTAIAGGVQVLGLDAGANDRNTPVSSSFPGRMNWDTNAPRLGRLDGWIVQFGGNAGAVPDKAPEKVKVWALCVPNTDIPVVETFKQSS